MKLKKYTKNNYTSVIHAKSGIKLPEKCGPFQRNFCIMRIPIPGDPFNLKKLYISKMARSTVGQCRRADYFLKSHSVGKFKFSKKDSLKQLFPSVFCCNKF